MMKHRRIAVHTHDKEERITRNNVVLTSRQPLLLCSQRIKGEEGRAGRWYNNVCGAIGQRYASQYESILLARTYAYVRSAFRNTTTSSALLACNIVLVI